MSELNEREIVSLKAQLADLYNEIRRLDTENRERDKQLMRAEVVREYEAEHKKEFKEEAEISAKGIAANKMQLVKIGAVLSLIGGGGYGISVLKDLS